MAVHRHVHRDANLLGGPRVVLRVLRGGRVVVVAAVVGKHRASHPPRLDRALDVRHHRRGQALRQLVQPPAVQQSHRGGVEVDDDVVVVVAQQILDVKRAAVVVVVEQFVQVVQIDDPRVTVRLVDHVLLEEVLVVGLAALAGRCRGVPRTLTAERLEHVGVGGWV